MKKVLIVVVSYNEAENIGNILSRILKETSRLQSYLVDVLVVDGHSPDGTASVVEALAKTNPKINLLVEEKKEGLGPAYAKGFKWGLDRDYDLLFECDADLSHDPKYIPEMLRLSEGSDLVIGSRYVAGGGTVGWGFLRRAISFGASLYTRAITGLPIHYVTGGFKCFHREVLEQVRFDDVQAFGYGFQIELNYRVWKAGFKIAETPIIFPDREKGVSKFNSRIFLEALVLVWRLRLGI